MTDVKVPDPAFMDDYDTGGAYVEPPQPKIEVPGKSRAQYLKLTGQAPSEAKIKTREADGKTFLKTREGYFKAIIEGITLPNDGGYEIGQTHLSSAQYRKFKGGQPTGELRNASPFLDYLHAHAIDMKPANPEEYETYIKATADRQFQFTGDWNAWDKDTQSDVAEKWEDFPMLYEAPDGTFSIDPTKGKATGRRQPFIEKNGKRFWARLQVKQWISAL